MDINTTQQLNINQTSVSSSKTSVQNTLDTEETKFSDELKKAEMDNKSKPVQKKTENEKEKNIRDAKKDKHDDVKQTLDVNNNQADNKQIDNAIDGLKDAVSEINKIGQKEENFLEVIKPDIKLSVIEEKTEIEDNNLIDNNMNVKEPAEKVNIQTETGTNFSSNGQPFAEFINQDNKVNGLRATEKELAEEKAILSTMEENIAIAKKNMLLKEKAGNDVEQKKITVQNEEGIKKVDSKTNLTVETIVSYEKVVMDKADVDFFVNLVENGSVNINDIQSAVKSAHVSKTLADLLAKAMNENKPVRIDFDNDISVIIKIDRAGKISADFLPSSQVAEAYLRENLPLLRQRFDDNNIDYNELNQRKQKQDTQDNRKKERKDE